MIRRERPHSYFVRRDTIVVHCAIGVRLQKVDGAVDHDASPREQTLNFVDLERHPTVVL
jgi:hypothetical protein